MIKNRIGLAVARRLAQDGAAVTISSRKEKNVVEAVAKLKDEGLDVVGKCELHRQMWGKKRR